MSNLLLWRHGALLLWGSPELRPGHENAPIAFSWGPTNPPPIAQAPDPPLPEQWRYLVDRLTAIADTACSYREYRDMEIPDSIRITHLHAGLDLTAKRLRELIIELSGHDPWQGIPLAHHPPGTAP